MKQRLERLARQWGQSVAREGEARQWYAFLQPMRRKNRQEERAVTPLGEVDWRQWLYIGPASEMLAQGEILCSGGERFFVRECAAVYLGGAALYRRAVLVRAKEAQG